MACGQVASIASGNPVSPSQHDDEHVADAAVGQLGAHARPELGALGRLHPDPQHVLDPVQVDAHRDVRGLVADLVAVPDLHDQGVEVDDRVELLQRPRLPGLDLLRDGVGDLGDRLVRQVGADRAGEVVLDVPHRHPARVQRDDHLVEPAGPPGALGDQARLERAGPVPWGRQSHVADLGGQRLGRRAVAGVGAPPARRVALLVAEMLGQLGRQAPLEHRLDHLGQKPALAGQLQVAGVNLGHQLIEQAGINQLPDRRTGIRMARRLPGLIVVPSHGHVTTSCR